MQFQTVIFDMDGTLVSSLGCIYHCVNEITQTYLKESRSLEQIISNFGPPAYVIIENLTSKLSKDLQQQAVADYYNCYQHNVRNKVLIFPGITELLRKLQKSQRHVGLVTGVERKLMDYTMQGLRLSQYFEMQICSDDVKKSKPDPEGINLILEHTNSKPVETLFVGDSPVDMRTGRAAGVKIGAALWSPENLGDPRTEKPDYEFPSVQLLTNFLFPKETTSTHDVYFGPQWQTK